MNDLARLLSTIPDDVGDPEPIAPLFADGAVPGLAEWQTLRRDLRSRWDAVIGRPAFGDFDRAAEIVDIFDQPGYRATVYRQPTGPETRQTVLVLAPRRRQPRDLPGIVVPFYDPDRMAGISLGTHEPIEDAPVIQFGRHLIRQGYVVACSEAFPYNTVPEPPDSAGLNWWKAGAEKLLADNPGWTGMGKLAWDASCALDLLLDQPRLDPSRVGVMGHSLGGKIAFYAAALDDRFKAVIGSDFGIGYSFTNWDAPWYLGSRIHEPGFPLAHHHLLALIAPRPFLLIGGNTDRPASWQYLREARQVYALYGRAHAVGSFHHGTGHRPTEESLRIAYRWLAGQFGLPERPWEL